MGVKNAVAAGNCCQSISALQKIGKKEEHKKIICQSQGILQHNHSKDCLN